VPGAVSCQFGKYLNGDSFSTSYNLKRICDFFGVEGYEIALPANQFASLVSDRHRPEDPVQITAPQRAIERFLNADGDADSVFIVST
jgi:hypothetical protein